MHSQHWVHSSRAGGSVWWALSPQMSPLALGTEAAVTVVFPTVCSMLTEGLCIVLTALLSPLTVPTNNLHHSLWGSVKMVRINPWTCVSTTLTVKARFMYPILLGWEFHLSKHILKLAKVISYTQLDLKTFHLSAKRLGWCSGLEMGRLGDLSLDCGCHS